MKVCTKCKQEKELKGGIIRRVAKPANPNKPAPTPKVEIRSKPAPYPQFKEAIGQRVKAVRNSLKMTIVDFAGFLSDENYPVSASAIGLIESGRMAMNVFILIRLKKAAKASFDYILLGHGENIERLATQRNDTNTIDQDDMPPLPTEPNTKNVNIDNHDSNEEMQMSICKNPNELNNQSTNMKLPVQLLKPKDVFTILNISERQLHILGVRGDIAYITVGKKARRYDPEDVREYMDRQRNAKTRTQP